jgi:hypothetical protein
MLRRTNHADDPRGTAQPVTFDPPSAVAILTRSATVARDARLNRYRRLFFCEALLQRLAQDLQTMAAALWQFIQQEHTVVGQRHFTRHRHVAPADQPRVRDGVGGARHGRVVTDAVRSPVRPTTRWIGVVSIASARVMAGRMVVTRCAWITRVSRIRSPSSGHGKSAPGGTLPRDRGP